MLAKIKKFLEGLSKKAEPENGTVIFEIPAYEQANGHLLVTAADLAWAIQHGIVSQSPLPENRKAWLHCAVDAVHNDAIAAATRAAELELEEAATSGVSASALIDAQAGANSTALGMICRPSARHPGWGIVFDTPDRAV